MTPKQKVEDLELQINRCMRGEQTSIKCPYCGVEILPTDGALCCNDMGLVVRAVLRRKAQLEVLEQASEIMDKAADLAARN